MNETSMNEAGMDERRLSESERDDAYTRICLAITEAGPERESLFLARLCLLLAEQAGEFERVAAAIESAKLR